MKKLFKLLLPSLNSGVVIYLLIVGLNLNAHSKSDFPVPMTKPVQFPLLVTTSRLTLAPDDKNHQLNQWLERAQQEGEPAANLNLFSSEWLKVVQIKNKHESSPPAIFVKESGAFALTLEAGSEFEIADKDVEDGSALIRLPVNTYEVFVYLPKEKEDAPTLEIEDGLFYVKDTLSYKGKVASDQGHWMLLGNRPLPVPADWRSQNGEKLIIHFKHQNLKSFFLAFRKSTQAANFPPGVKVIGPEGGAIELPGVAQVVLMKNSVEEPVVFSVRQQLEAPGLPGELPTDTEPSSEYISPVIKLEPMDIKLKQPMIIDLVINKERLGKSPIHVTQWLRAKRLESCYDWSEKINTVLLPFYPAAAYELGYVTRIADKRHLAETPDASK